MIISVKLSRLKAILLGLLQETGVFPRGGYYQNGSAYFGSEDRASKYKSSISSDLEYNDEAVSDRILQSLLCFHLLYSFGHSKIDAIVAVFFKLPEIIKGADKKYQASIQKEFDRVIKADAQIQNDLSKFMLGAN